MVGGNIGIHHWLDGFLLWFAVLVKVIVIHIKGTVTTKAEAEPLSKHHYRKFLIRQRNRDER